MRRVLARLIPSPALGVAIVALVLAAGGITYAATSSESVIRACANKRTGALRIANRCKRNERRVTWGVVGPQGRQGARGFIGSRGFSGAQGAPGATGKEGKEGQQGPAGPGATTFSTTAFPSTTVTLATLGNGISVRGICPPSGNVQLQIATTSGSSSLQTSGTFSASIATPPVEPAVTNNTTSVTTFTDSGFLDFDGLARDSLAAGAKFAHIDVHGQAGTPCTFWGMVIPSG
jgi:hypothetical protein